jgi:hypothetical protein
MAATGRQNKSSTARFEIFMVMIQIVQVFWIVSN